MKSLMAALCSALATVGAFVVFERTLEKIVREIPWPYIPSILYFLAIGVFPGYIAAQIVERSYSTLVGAIGTAVGAIFVMSALSQRVNVPFEVSREFALLTAIAIPALSGAIMAKLCTPRSGG